MYSSSLAIPSRRIRRKVLTDLGSAVSVILAETVMTTAVTAVAEGKASTKDQKSRRGQQPTRTKFGLFPVKELDQLILEHAGLTFANSTITIEIGNAMEAELLRKFPPEIVRSMVMDSIDHHERDQEMRSEADKAIALNSTAESEPQAPDTSQDPPPTARIAEGPSAQAKPQINARDHSSRPDAEATTVSAKSTPNLPSKPQNFQP